MATQAMAMVWEHAPQTGITGNALVVLLRMADAADPESLISWESTPTMAAAAGIHESTVNRCLVRLKALNIITDVPDDEAPVKSHRYSSVVRRINTPDQWSSPTEPVGDETAECEPSQSATPRKMTPLELSSINSRDRKMTANSNYLTGNSKLEVVETSFLQSSRRSDTKGWAAVEAKIGKPASGKRKTKRQQQIELAAAADATDISNLLGDDPQPEPEAPATGDPLAEGRAKVAANRKQRALRPAENLARMFAIVGQRATTNTAPGTANLGALQRNIGIWLREGTSEETIREMIEAYWADGYPRSTERPAWQDFLAGRGKVFSQIARAEKSTEVEANRHDLNFWR